MHEALPSASSQGNFIVAIVGEEPLVPLVVENEGIRGVGARAGYRITRSHFSAKLRQLTP